MTWKSFVVLDTHHRSCDKGNYDVTNSKRAVGRQVKALVQHPNEILLKTTNGKRRPSSDTTKLTTDNGLIIYVVFIGIILFNNVKA